MATVRQFEDLLVWRKARELTREIYRALGRSNDRGFADQIQRAAVSVVSNIAEGFESGTRQEFVNYLYIAKGSCGEVRAQLYIAHDVGYLETLKFKDLKERAEEVSRLLSGFIKGVKSSPHQGLQRKREFTKSEREEEAFREEIKREAEKYRKERIAKGGIF